jgi:hypothetical protein
VGSKVISQYFTVKSTNTIYLIYLRYIYSILGMPGYPGALGMFGEPGEPGEEAAAYLLFIVQKFNYLLK